MSNQILYEITPGSIKNPEDIRKLSEIELFLTIDNLLVSIFGAWHKTNNDGSPIDLTNDFLALQFCAYETRKFGVETKKINNDEIELNSSYDSWYCHWKDYFENMSEDEMEFFNDALINGKDLTVFGPEKSFKESQKVLKK